MNFNEEQLRAIRARGQNVTVFASAGAGKTGVLIERLYQRLAGDRLSIRRILAMTFTDAAAQEMKQRLHQRLEAGIEEEADPAVREHLSTQLALLPSADICTIDSFCLKLIRDFSAILGWDPQRYANVFDNQQVAAFKNGAAYRTIERHYVDPGPTFISLLERLSASGNDTEKLQELLIRVGAAASAEIDPEEWFSRAASFYDDHSALRELPAPFDRYFFDERRCLLEYAGDLLDRFESVVTAGGPSEVFSGAAAELRQALAAAEGCLRDRDYAGFCRAASGLKDFKLPSCLKATHIKKDDFPAYDEYRDRITKLLGDLFPLPDEGTLLRNLRSQKPLIGLVLQLAREYLAEFRKIKEANSGIDFQDMEAGAISLLKAQGGYAADILRSQYEEILVDEYQDSNNIQETLISLICRKDPGNVFRVGDVKQSIYGFRGAKPELMRSLIQNGDPKEVIRFRKNYRSSEVLVRFSNLLFKSLMNIAGHDDTYLDGVDTAEYGKGDRQSQDAEPVRIEVFDEKAYHRKADLQAAEARQIIARIQDMRKNTPYAQFRDYVILVRKNQLKNVLEPVFKEAGMPYFFMTTFGYFLDASVAAVLAWLKLLRDPNDQISLVAVLRSDYYRLDEDRLAELKLSLQKGERWLDGLERLGHPLAGDYRRLDVIARTKNLTELFAELYALNDYYSGRTAPFQRDNLDLFFDYAVKGTGQGLSLSMFLDQLAAHEDADQGTASSMSVDADVVRVMTVHNAKGLQFPVVFYLADSFGTAASAEAFELDDQLGISCRNLRLPYYLTSPSVLSEAIKRRQARNDIEEAIRVMYVAATRAAARMVIVTAAVPDASAGGPLSAGYLAAGFRRKGFMGDLLKTALGSADPALVQFRAVSEPLAPAAEKRVTVNTDKLRKYSRAVTSCPAKAPSARESRFIRPLGKRSVSATERGVLIHKAFERLDFSDFREPDIAGLGLGLTPEDIAEISAFFDQPIAKEIVGYELHKEYPFVYKEGGAYLRGAMDLVAISGKELVMIDFKSDRDKDKASLADHYRDQITAYRKALERGYPDKRIRCYIYGVAARQLIEMPG